MVHSACFSSDMEIVESGDFFKSSFASNFTSMLFLCIIVLSPILESINSPTTSIGFWPIFLVSGLVSG